MRFNIYTENHQEVMDMLNLGGISCKLTSKTTWNNKGALSWQYDYKMSFEEEHFTAAVFLSEMSSTLTVAEGESTAVFEKLKSLFEVDEKYTDPNEKPKVDKDSNLSCLLGIIVIFSPAAYGIYNLFFV